MFNLGVAEGVSEVATVVEDIKSILESVPGWNIFLGIVAVTLVGGFVVGLVSHFKR